MSNYASFNLKKIRLTQDDQIIILVQPFEDTSSVVVRFEECFLKFN